MAKKIVNQDISILFDTIIEAMHERKANRVTSIDFKTIHSPVCDYFIIAQAESTTQVAAIADHILDEVKLKTGQSATYKEGFENAQWILLDYLDIVVHIFQTDYRKFYNLEGLWADAVIVSHIDKKTKPVKTQ